MRVGAVIASSVLLIDQILNSRQSAKLVLKKYIRNNKYIGSKDKKLLYEITFSTLKKYHGLLDVCRDFQITIKTKNLVFFNFCNKFKNSKFEDLFIGKYSITEENEDSYIYDKAINFYKEVMPKLPKWIEKRLSLKSDIDINNLYESITLDPKFDIAINKIKYSRGIIKKRLLKLNIKCNLTKTSPYGLTISKRISKNNLEKIQKDIFEVQDEGSQIVTLLTNIKPDMEVLDFCAGKGTKTIFMNNIVKNLSNITVYDKSEERLKVLKNRIKKYKLNNIKFNFDNKNPVKFFDVVLCDVPCTGTGTWRRRPENIIWLNNKELNDFKKTQYNILSEAAQLCKSGGQLIYITCSLLYDENEYQIKKFLKNNTDFQAFNIEERVKSFFRDNISGISRYGFVLTPDILNTDGYFISILNKSIN